MHALRIRRLGLIAFLVAALPGVAYSDDVLFLTNGNRLRGEIQSEDAQCVKIRMPGLGEQSIKKEKIDRIERDADIQKEYARKCAEVRDSQSSSAGQLVELGKWCEARFLIDEAIHCYREAVELDPENKVAKILLSAISTRTRNSEKRPSQRVSKVSRKPRSPRVDLPPILRKLEPVTATEIYEAFQENEIRAETAYGDKDLLIRGRVKNIGRDLSGTMYVLLYVKNERLGGVQCFLPEGDPKTMAKLEKGDMVYAQGRYLRKLVHVLLQCKAINSSTDLLMMVPKNLRLASACLNFRPYRGKNHTISRVSAEVGRFRLLGIATFVRNDGNQAVIGLSLGRIENGLYAGEIVVLWSIKVDSDGAVVEMQPHNSNALRAKTNFESPRFSERLHWRQ